MRHATTTRKKFTEIRVMHVQKCFTDLNQKPLTPIRGYMLLRSKPTAFCRAPCHRHRRH